jgi:hypothetical protein
LLDSEHRAEALQVGPDRDWMAQERAPGEAGDLLDGDTAVGHEADEGEAQFAGCPQVPDSGGFDGGAELAAHVGGVELTAVPGGEHRPGDPAFAFPHLP